MSGSRKERYTFNESAHRTYAAMLQVIIIESARTENFSHTEGNEAAIFSNGHILVVPVTVIYGLESLD